MVSRDAEVVRNMNEDLPPPDGTILDGNHRIHVLRKRGVDVDGLPREIVARTDL